MSLTEKQIEGYRKKLGDSEYMERAIDGIAEKLSTGYAMVELPYAETEINNVEEKEMAKNKLIDLNDHLFERIEWLTDQDIKGAELTEEIKRTEMVIKVSEQIIKNADLVHRATLAVAKYGSKITLPAMIEDKPK
jgi:hypothetical protein